MDSIGAVEREVLGTPLRALGFCLADDDVAALGEMAAPGRTVLRGARIVGERERSVEATAEVLTDSPERYLLLDLSWAGVAEAERFASEEDRFLEFRYQTLIEHIPAITYVEMVDDAGDGSGATYVSPQLSRMLGLDYDDVAEFERWLDHVHPDDRDVVREAAARADATRQSFDIEYRVFARDGRLVWLRDEAAFIEDPVSGRRYWQGIMTDITPERVAQEQLELAHRQVRFLAYHDPLTGLGNRALLEEMLEAALARARRAGSAVVVVYLDLNGFKGVNDAWGHQSGDALLQQVARRLETVVREADLAVRQGGDEFLLLLPDVEIAEAPDVQARICRRIEEVMASPFQIGPALIECSASIGACVYPVDAADGGELLRTADHRMYAAKQGSLTWSS